MGVRETQWPVLLVPSGSAATVSVFHGVHGAPPPHGEFAWFHRVTHEGKDAREEALAQPAHVPLLTETGFNGASLQTQPFLLYRGVMTTEEAPAVSAPSATVSHTTPGKSTLPSLGPYLLSEQPGRAPCKSSDDNTQPQPAAGTSRSSSSAAAGLSRAAQLYPIGRLEGLHPPRTEAINPNGPCTSSGLHS